MLQYAIYARKSDDDTSVTEKSISEQLEACDALALRDGLEVVWRKDESKTAKVPNVRPVFKDLIQELKRGKANAILCWHLNRLARNPAEGGDVAQLFVDGKLKEIRTPHGVYRSGDNIIPLMLEMASAAQYSIDLSRTVSRSHEGNFHRGNCNNRVPQGYRNVRNPLNFKVGIVEIDPERFASIQKAWTLAAADTHSIADVHRVLEDEWGYRTRATKKLASHALSLNGLYTLFRNPFYAGFVRYKGELEPGNHTPMITLETFYRVQAILDRNRRQKVKKRSYVFSGLMFCGYCGRQVTGEVKTMKNLGLFETYHCSDTRNTCTAKGLSCRKVEERILGELEKLTIDTDLAELGRKQILGILARQESRTGNLIQSHQTALKKVDERIAGLNDMWLSNLITDQAEFRRLKERELAIKRDLTMKMKDHRSETDVMRQNVTEVADFCAFSRERFMSGGDEAKRRVARSLAKSYKFFGHTKELQINIKPLLSEFVAYSHTLTSPLEPPKSGSQNTQEPAPKVPVLDGGTSEAELELPARLIEALREPNLEPFDPLLAARHHKENGRGSADSSLADLAAYRNGQHPKPS